MYLGCVISIKVGICVQLDLHLIFLIINLTLIFLPADIEIRLEPSSQTVAEGSSATFSVVTTGQSDLPFSVLFRTEDGIATGK